MSSSMNATFKYLSSCSTLINILLENSEIESNEELYLSGIHLYSPLNHLKYIDVS